MEVIAAKRSFICYPAPVELDSIHSTAVALDLTAQELVKEWLAVLARHRVVPIGQILKTRTKEPMISKKTKNGISLHPSEDEAAVLQTLAAESHTTPEALVNHWISHLLASDAAKHLPPAPPADAPDVDSPAPVEIEQ